MLSHTQNRPLGTLGYVRRPRRQESYFLRPQGATSFCSDPDVALLVSHCMSHWKVSPCLPGTREDRNRCVETDKFGIESTLNVYVLGLRKFFFMTFFFVRYVRDPKSSHACTFSSLLPKTTTCNQEWPHPPSRAFIAGLTAGLGPWHG